MDPAVIADPESVKCTITGKLRDSEDECDCNFSRKLYDKRTNMEANGNDAVGAIESLKDHIEHGYKKVDVKYVYNALLDVVNEGIISDKLNEVITYLEEFILS